MTGPLQEPSLRGTVDTRLKIAALWISTLFIFAYVDLVLPLPSGRTR